MRTNYVTTVVFGVAVLGITLLGLQFTMAPISGQEKGASKNQPTVKEGDGGDKPLAIDLLNNARPEKHSIKGEWEFQGKDLVSTAAAQCILEIPHNVPEEYTLKLEVERKAGSDALVIGLVIGDRRCLVVLDAGPKIGYLSGLEMIDGKHAAINETTRKGAVLKDGASSEVLCIVRRDAISVTLDGKTIIEYKGSWNRLSLGDYWKTPNDRALFVGSQTTTYRISRMELTTLPSKPLAKKEPAERKEFTNSIGMQF